MGGWGYERKNFLCIYNNDGSDERKITLKNNIKCFVVTTTHLILVDDKKTFHSCEIGNWKNLHEKEEAFHAQLNKMKILNDQGNFIVCTIEEQKDHLLILDTKDFKV
jgi:archaellum biogenesis ATPase FlaH